MIVDQVSEVIDDIPEDEHLGITKTAQHSHAKFNRHSRKGPNDDHEMVQVDSTVAHRDLKPEAGNETAYMTNSRMMRDQLILPPQPQVTSHSRYVRAQRQQNANWIDQLATNGSNQNNGPGFPNQ